MQLNFGAPLLTEPTELRLEEVPLAAIHHRSVTLDQLGEIFDKSFGALGAAAAAGDIAPAGPALAVYHGDPAQPFDMEVAFPVDSLRSDAITRDGVEIVRSTIAAGPAMGVTHLGAYEDLGNAWSEFITAVDALGKNVRDGISIEVYVTDPSSEERPLRTDLIVLV